MLEFIVRMKVPATDPVLGGGFQMHPGGEVDIRGTYTALAVLPCPRTLPNHVQRCQSCES
jgi:hypothetical protein